jgi:citrate synthase
MLEEIHRTGGDADKYWQKPKIKWSVPMGFGHRVYKFWSRAKIIKKAADEVLET